MKATFLIVFVLIFSQGISQEKRSVIPDQKDGKYALVKINAGKKEPLTAYEFDFINEGYLVAQKDGPGRNAFFSCQKGEKWGVLTEDGKYQLELQKLDSLWMLRSKDAYRLQREKNLYDYYGLNGKPIAQNIVDEKRSPYARYRILIKEDGTQSIIHRGQEVVKPIPYELDLKIQNLAKTFLVRNKSGYHVINLDGFPLNTEPYEAATPIDFNGNLAAKKNGKWKVLDAKLEPVDDQTYSEVIRKESDFGKRYYYLCTKENKAGLYIYAGDDPVLVSEDPVSDFAVEKSFGVGRQNGKWAVLSPVTLEYTDFIYDRFDRVDQKEAYYHLMFCQKDGFYNIVDEEGNTFYESVEIEKIQPLTCQGSARLKLYKDEKIALVNNPSKEPEPSFVYEDVKCAEKGYYLKKDGKWGMMNDEGKVVVEFKYDNYTDIKP